MLWWRCVVQYAINVIKPAFIGPGFLWTSKHIRSFFLLAISLAISQPISLIGYFFLSYWLFLWRYFKIREQKTSIALRSMLSINPPILPQYLLGLHFLIDEQFCLINYMKLLVGSRYLFLIDYEFFIFVW